MLEPIFSIRNNIFLGFARRTAPDFDYNSDSACRTGQVRKMQKNVKNHEKIDFFDKPQN